MRFVEHDGGRVQAGYKGKTGDCVTRAVAIVTGLPYQTVYEALAVGNAGERRTARSKASSGKRTAAHGIYTGRLWFKRYMCSLGLVWTPTMRIGSGCKVHLHDGELPAGRLVVSLSKHLTAVIDGVIYDTFDPQREAHAMDFNGATRSDDPRVIHTIQRRCVYGYWTLSTKAS